MDSDKQDRVDQLLEQLVTDENSGGDLKRNGDDSPPKVEDISSQNEITKDNADRKSRSKKSSLSINDLKIKREMQNLEERKLLIQRLFILFVIQLSVMNAIVLITVLWVYLDLPFLKNANLDVLELIVDLIKYYIVVVLAELLGGIIFIVHQVFSYKATDKPDN